MQRNPEQVHAAESHGDRERNGGGHDDGGAPVHQKERDEDDDQHGFHERGDEERDALVHGLGLVGDRCDIDSRR